MARLLLWFELGDAIGEQREWIFAAIRESPRNTGEKTHHRRRHWVPAIDRKDHCCIEGALPKPFGHP
jgi:hypothetical protein